MMPVDLLKLRDLTGPGSGFWLASRREQNRSLARGTGGSRRGAWFATPADSAMCLARREHFGATHDRAESCRHACGHRCNPIDVFEANRLPDHGR